MTSWFLIDHYMVTVQYGALTDDVELQDRAREVNAFEADWIRRVPSESLEGRGFVS